MKRFLLVVSFFLVSVSSFGGDLVGSWRGDMRVGMSKLSMIINISDSLGVLKATMDVPIQGVKGDKINLIELKGDSLIFALTSLRVKYSGKIDSDSIVGNFTQRGMSFSLTFKRVAKGEDAYRKPQDPKKPYPYIYEDVTFKNRASNITLSGTLTYPHEGSNFPIVVLVSGSGPQNRDESLLGHRPFLVLSDYLTRRGIAVLRYDDRGVGQSEGIYNIATLSEFASDAASAIDYVYNRCEFDKKRVGILGHSEGGTIAFNLAAREGSKLNFIVSMAGMAVHGDTLMRSQRVAILNKMGYTEEFIQKNEEMIAQAKLFIKRHGRVGNQTSLDSLAMEFLPDSINSDKQFKSVFMTGVRQLSSPEIYSLMNCDPAAWLSKIECPVLALNGEKDLQVLADLNLENLKRLVNANLTIKRYSNLNHLFQNCTTGLPVEYGQIDETISEEVLNDIASWILTN